MTERFLFQSASDEEQQDEDGKLTCPYDAGCAFFVFVCLFNKMDINFCPFKFIQKFGAVNRHEKPTCTNILNVMEKLRFIEKAHSCDTQEENHDERLNEIGQKLVETKQKAGLLWYSKEETKHCVTVYVGSTGAQMKIQDAQLNRNYITELQSVRKFILFVLKCDSKGEPLIKNKWNDACNAEICKIESQMLGDSLPIHNDSNEVV